MHPLLFELFPAAERRDPLFQGDERLRGGIDSCNRLFEQAETVPLPVQNARHQQRLAGGDGVFLQKFDRIFAHHLAVHMARLSTDGDGGGGPPDHFVHHN